MLIAILKSLFTVRQKTDIETFLADKNPQTREDLEFWLAEYDNRVRMASRLRSEGRYIEANYVLMA